MSISTPNTAYGHSVVMDTSSLKDWLNENWFVYVFRFVLGILFSLANITTKVS